jgi:hypothetical protein
MGYPYLPLASWGSLQASTSVEMKVFPGMSLKIQHRRRSLQSSSDDPPDKKEPYCEKSRRLPNHKENVL